MKIRFTKTAIKNIKKLDTTAKKRIEKKLLWLVSQEDPLCFAEPLIDTQIGEYRFRIGDYRVIFDVEKDTIIVHMIGDRKKIYK